MKTNTELQRDVLDELAWEPGVDAAEIGVSVNSGIVILNGVVKSLAQKWTAELAAQRVEGVRAVTDELVVQLPGENQHSDPEIARAAANALDWNTAVPRNRIKILVKHGCVTLEGHVEYRYQKDAAEGAIRNLTGVQAVLNLIVVKPRVSAPDVKYQIYKALERAAQVESQNISVEAVGGKVILRGDTRTWAERDEVERAAWAAPGVSEVENNIRICRLTNARGVACCVFEKATPRGKSGYQAKRSLAKEVMAMRRILLYSVLVLLLCAAGAIGRPAEDETLPLNYAPSGKLMYKQYCAACHGADAKGDGPLASFLKIPPSDLTTLAKRHAGKFPYDYVSNVLRFGTDSFLHGSSDMPTWGPIFQYYDKNNERVVQQRIKNLCDYLASLQGN